MPKRILVPLDGSKRSERALPVAARLARATSGTLVLVRTVPKADGDTAYEGAGPFQYMGVTLTKGIDDIGEIGEARTYLAEIAAFDALDDIPTEIGVYSGSEAPTILATARDREADAIVLCARGQSGPTYWGLGRVARQVVEAAPIPVLVIHEEGPLPGWVYDKSPPRAVVALDGSTQAEAALTLAAEYVEALAGPSLAALRLVHVAGSEAVAEDAEAYLSAVAYEFRAGSLSHRDLLLSWSVMRGNDVARVLTALDMRFRPAAVEEIALGPLFEADAGGETYTTGSDTSERSERSDLIALSRFGYTGLEEGTLGPVTEAVLRLAMCPVLIVPPPAEAEGDRFSSGTANRET
jgi:nucleotide-binding universal stress UspA family protein